MPIVRPQFAKPSTLTDPRVLGLQSDPIPALEPRFPQWLDDEFGMPARWDDAGSGMRVSSAGPLLLLAVTIPQAVLMPAGRLRAEVSRAYRDLTRWLASSDRVAIRFWNYVPGIGDAMGQGLDRYMVFNAGRYEAFDGGDERPDSFERSLATASAVGVGGSDLVIHCMATDAPGIPVENPRQTPSWRYSRRFGPMPPCFARAIVTTLMDRPTLLIAGTASIVGEASLHEGDAPAQFAETLRNLAAIIHAAAPDSVRDPLSRLVHLRAYAITNDVARMVRDRLTASCPDARSIEVSRAQVCRPELLLEIEGVAEV
jgi:chorismate lyase/3-hydroxybenzoate synthase